MLVPTTVDGEMVVTEANRQKFDSQLLNDGRRNDTNKRLSATSKKKSAKKFKSGNQLDDDEIAILISEVEKRPPLWNFTLPLQQRSKQIKESLYKEVSQELNGKLSAKQVQAKFKSLRDTFRKIILFEQQASGPARPDEQPKWKFYHLMNFVRDLFSIQNNTESNVPMVMNDSMDIVFIKEEDTEEQLSSNSLESDDLFAENCSQELTRQRSSRSTSSIQEDYKNVLNKIQLPTPPEADELQSLLHSTNLQLRKLPYEIRMELAMNFMQTVHQTVIQHMRNSND